MELDDSKTKKEIALEEVHGYLEGPTKNENHSFLEDPRKHPDTKGASPVNYENIQGFDSYPFASAQWFKDGKGHVTRSTMEMHPCHGGVQRSIHNHHGSYEFIVCAHKYKITRKLWEKSAGLDTFSNDEIFRAAIKYQLMLFSSASPWSKFTKDMTISVDGSGNLTFIQTNLSGVPAHPWMNAMIASRFVSQWGMSVFAMYLEKVYGLSMLEAYAMHFLFPKIYHDATNVFLPKKDIAADYPNYLSTHELPVYPCIENGPYYSPVDLLQRNEYQGMVPNAYYYDKTNRYTPIDVPHQTPFKDLVTASALLNCNRHFSRRKYRIFYASKLPADMEDSRRYWEKLNANKFKQFDLIEIAPAVAEWYKNPAKPVKAVEKFIRNALDERNYVENNFCD